MVLVFIVPIIMLPKRKAMKCFGRTLGIVIATFGRKMHLPRKGNWESVIGLEVHAQVLAKSKLFSSAPADYGAAANAQVTTVDAAIPGSLPVLNRTSVDAAILTGLALNCRVNNVSTFDRKHYFYADSPAGYQITQQRNPIASTGKLEFVVFSPGIHKTPYYHSCKIKQLQLEQDSGKSLHDPVHERSLIDLNRAGMSLMEIVFEPDLRDGEEAGALVKELMLILEKINTCDCKMEEGSLRVDANISVRQLGDPLGVRTEVKNISSVRHLVNAVEYEVRRQIDVLERGDDVVNETRAYDAIKKATIPMREKETKQDYRFMPEPNLPPLRVTYDPQSSDEPNLFHIQKRLVELPEASRQKLMKKFGLTLQHAIILVNLPGLNNYFLDVMKLKPDARAISIATILLQDVLHFLNESSLDFTACPILPSTFADVYTLMESDKIDKLQLREMLKIIYEGDSRGVEQIYKEEKFELMSDEGEIERICKTVVENNEKLVRKYYKNPAKHEKKLILALRAAGQGRLNIKKASKRLLKMLESVSVAPASD